jgi:hypothetical protein
VPVDAIAVDGVWWRQLPHGGDPLFRADPPSDGRWQHGEIVGGVYFAQDDATSWAEWYRALAEFAIPPERQMPRDLWRWQIQAHDVADLSDAAKLASLKLSLPRPTGASGPRSNVWASDSGVRAIAASSRQAQPDPPPLCCACSARLTRSAARPRSGRQRRIATRPHPRLA